jgi:hypothetical protein
MRWEGDGNAMEMRWKCDGNAMDHSEERVCGKIRQSTELLLDLHLLSEDKR